MEETNTISKALELSASYRSLSNQLEGLASAAVKSEADVPAELKPAFVEYKRVLNELKAIGYADVADLFPMQSVSHGIEQANRGIKSSSEPPSYSSFEKMNEMNYVVIGESASANGKCMKQAEWRKYYAERGEVMLAAPDLYSWLKQKKRMAGSVLPDAFHKYSLKLLNGVRKDMRKVALALNTKIQYGTNRQNPLEGIIMHHYDEANSLFKYKSPPITIPIFKTASLSTVFSQNEDSGLEFLRHLFCTQDEPEEMASILDFLRGGRGDARISTADLESRYMQLQGWTFASLALGFADIFCAKGDIYQIRSRSVRVLSGPLAVDASELPPEQTPY